MKPTQKQIIDALVKQLDFMKQYTDECTILDPYLIIYQMKVFDLSFEEALQNLLDNPKLIRNIPSGDRTIPANCTREYYKNRSKYNFIKDVEDGSFINLFMNRWKDEKKIILEFRKLLNNEFNQNDFTTSDTKSIVNLLKTKRQIILYGPPGTGKTFVTKEVARGLCKEGDK